MPARSVEKVRGSLTGDGSTGSAGDRLLAAVAFVLGVAITWLITVERVTQTVRTDGADVGGSDEGGNGMGGSEAQGADDPAPEHRDEAEPRADAPADASRFGGEHTGATARPRVGWDDDAEDVDALLSNEEKSGEETSEGS